MKYGASNTYLMQWKIYPQPSAVGPERQAEAGRADPAGREGGPGGGEGAARGEGR